MGFGIRKRARKVAKMVYPLFRRIPLNRKKVFFESFSTRTFSDNPKAIYDELCSRQLDYKLVWALQDPSVDVGPRGKTVRYSSFGYWFHLGTAKYIVSNINQLQSVKRKGQVFVQTMHGTPLKRMGLVVTKKEWKRARMKQLFSRDWDYFTSPSTYFSDILRGPSFEFAGELLEVGYPRNDYLVNNKNNGALAAKVRAELGIPDGKKMILYAPTWRTKKGFDLKLDIEKMKQSLSDDYVLVLRPHYLEARYLDQSVFDDFTIDGGGYRDVNEMLIATDVLITDYSSILFDYAILRRPMILFMWDYDSYVKSGRGTYFDIEQEYPQLVARTNEQILQKFDDLDKVMQGIEEFSARFNEFETGQASKMVVDRVFGATQC